MPTMDHLAAKRVDRVPRRDCVHRLSDGGCSNQHLRYSRTRGLTFLLENRTTGITGLWQPSVHQRVVNKSGPSAQTAIVADAVHHCVTLILGAEERYTTDSLHAHG